LGGVSDYILLFAIEPDAAVDLSALLEQAGYHVRTAVSEAQALALAAAALPLLAVVDLGVGEPDELFWLGELKRRFGRRPFPVVLLSSRDDVAEQAQRLFCEGWHPKPIDPSGLLALVRTAVQQAPVIAGP
jgi:DNA-binding response OmpR family regulator